MLNSRAVNSKVGPLRFGRMTLGINGSHKWPRSQRSSPVVWNSHTATDDWMLRKLSNEATGLSALYKSIRDPLVANFASRVGHCARIVMIVETFKHLLYVTTHPQFLALELRVPMGACPGQYSTTTDSLASLVDMYQAVFGTCNTKSTGSSTERWSLPEVWEQAYS